MYLNKLISLLRVSIPGGNLVLLGNSETVESFHFVGLLFLGKRLPTLNAMLLF